MKGKLVMLVIMLIMLSGCSQIPIDDIMQLGKNKIESQEKRNVSEQNNKIEEENTEDGSIKNDNMIDDLKEEKKEDLQFEIVNYGDVISTDFVEMTIDTIKSAEELKPSDTSGVYSYMADKENEKYFYLKGTLKNISGDSYDSEDIVAQITFDNKYNYNAYLTADDGGTNFYGNVVKPLGTITYYIYASVPDELIEMYSTCTIKFGFKENFGGSYFDEFDECDYLFQITGSR